MKIHHRYIVSLWNILHRLSEIPTLIISENNPTIGYYDEDYDTYYIDAEAMFEILHYEHVTIPITYGSWSYLKYKVYRFFLSKLYKQLHKHNDAIIVEWDMQKFRSKLRKEFEENYRKYMNKEN